MAWRDDVRAAVAAGGNDFAAHVTALAPTRGAWKHADEPALAGLEVWGKTLAERDAAAGIGALVLVAQHGFPIATDAGGDQIENMGYFAKEKHADGKPVEEQLARVLAWLDAPTDANRKRVAEAFDRTRQLNAWDPDMNVTDEVAFYWYLEVGQAACAAVLGEGDDPEGDSYYAWPAPLCVGRGLVLAIRGLRMPRTSVGPLVKAAAEALT